MPQETPSQYCCPGETHAISRAIHLGRLAAYYPGCRQCPHHSDTGTLSAGRVRRLAQTWRRAEPRPVFRDGTAAGACSNDLRPATARQLAAAFGVWLFDQRPETEDRPVVVIAGDGRSLTPELLAAAAEGLCWAGCHVIDLGTASAPCTAWAIAHLGTAGGILVGNPLGQVHTAGLRFWAPGARPLSADGPSDAVQQILLRRVDRPTRRSGSLRRFRAEAGYLAVLEPFYYALRPLRFLLRTTSPPLAGYIDQLTRPVACRRLPLRGTPNRIAEQVRADEAHFALTIDDDAQRCQLWDERGMPVAADRLLVLIARCLVTLGDDHELAPPTLSVASAHTEKPGDRLVVVEAATPSRIARSIRALGARVVTSDPVPAEMERTLRQHDALFGGGPSGRLWYRGSHRHFSADALVTLTLVLKILSQSDGRLSEVLDAVADAS